MVNSFTRTRAKRDDKKKVLLKELLLLPRYSLKGESEGNEHTLVEYVKCAPVSDEMDKDLSCACLQLTTRALLRNNMM